MMKNIKRITIALILIANSLYYTPAAADNQPKKLTRTIDYGSPEKVTVNTSTKVTNNSTAESGKKSENRRTGRRKAWWGKE